MIDPPTPSRQLRDGLMTNIAHSTNSIIITLLCLYYTNRSRNTRKHNIVYCRVVRPTRSTTRFLGHFDNIGLYQPTRSLAPLAAHDIVMKRTVCPCPRSFFFLFSNTAETEVVAKSASAVYYTAADYRFSSPHIIMRTARIAYYVYYNVTCCAQNI